MIHFGYSTIHAHLITEVKSRLGVAFCLWDLKSGHIYICKSETVLKLYFFVRCFWLLVILKRDTGSVTASWHQCAWCLLWPDLANFTRIQNTFLLQTTCVEVSVIKQVVYCNSTYFSCNHIIKLAENEQKKIWKTPLHAFSVIMVAGLLEHIMSACSSGFCYEESVMPSLFFPWF